MCAEERKGEERRALESGVTQRANCRGAMFTATAENVEVVARTDVSKLRSHEERNSDPTRISHAYF